MYINKINMKYEKIIIYILCNHIIHILITICVLEYHYARNRFSKSTEIIFQFTIIKFLKL